MIFPAGGITGETLTTSGSQPVLSEDASPETEVKPLGEY
jgi:hypothetical protein